MGNAQWSINTGDYDVTASYEGQPGTGDNVFTGDWAVAARKGATAPTGPGFMNSPVGTPKPMLWVSNQRPMWPLSMIKDKKSEIAVVAGFGVAMIAVGGVAAYLMAKRR